MNNADISYALHRRLAFLEVRLERDVTHSQGEWCDLEASALQVALERIGLFDADRLERMKQGVRDRVMPALDARRANVIPLRRIAT